MAIEIVDFPINSMVDLSIAMLVHQRVGLNQPVTCNYRMGPPVELAFNWDIFVAEFYGYDRYNELVNGGHHPVGNNTFQESLMFLFLLVVKKTC